MVTKRIDHKWGMVVDLDRCTGCQACVVACQAENNIPINVKSYYQQRRAYQWIRIEHTVHESSWSNRGVRCDQYTVSRQ